MVKLSTLLYYKVKGSTLVEILIASVIILASFSVAIGIIGKVAQQAEILDRIEANSVVNLHFGGTPSVDTIDHPGWSVAMVEEESSLGLAVQFYKCTRQEGTKKIFSRHRLSKPAK